ncbi:MAG: hypothetical protein IT374_12580 [Polyangiaceae bacterium]|nr:hypothetical protein [Polyangiaceae bacterium]
MLRAIGVLLAATAAARAADAPPLAVARPAEAASVAEALFVEGRRLMEAGRLDEACAKLDESQRLDPGGGTRMNAALCRERQGRLATAWAQFKLALSDARDDRRDDRVAFAEQHLTSLEPRLPRVVVTVGQGAPGASVLLDGLALGPAALGVAVPVDPGRHEVVLRADGSAPRVFTFDAKEGVTTRLTLEPAARDHARSTRQQRGLFSASAGAAAVVAGGAFLLVARSRQADADRVCPGTSCSAAQAGAVDDNASAHRWARAADVAFVLGAAGLAVGSYLIVTSGPAVSASAGPGGGFVALSRRF